MHTVVLTRRRAVAGGATGLWLGGEYLQKSLEVVIFLNERGCAVRVCLAAQCTRWGGTATCPYTMLWNNDSRAKDLRCSIVSHPRLSSMEVTLEEGEKYSSSALNHLKFGGEIFCMGSHAQAAYSSCGLTMVLYGGPDSLLFCLNNTLNEP